MRNVFSILLRARTRQESFTPVRLEPRGRARQRSSLISRRGPSRSSSEWRSIPLGLVALALSLLACAATAAAEPPITPNSELTLQRATDIALRLHPRRKQSESEVGVAQARVGEANANLLPQAYGLGEYLRSTTNGIGNTVWLNEALFPRISGQNHDLPSGDFSQSFSSHNNWAAGVSLEQFLLDFGRMRGLVDEQRADRDAAEARLKLTDLDLIYEVAERFYGLLAAEQIVRVYEQAIVQREAHLHQAQVMAKADLRPGIDVTITQADLSRAEMNEIQARNAADDAKVALDAAMGLAGEAPPYRAVGDLTYEPVTATLDNLQATALRLRPDLKALFDEARAAGAQIQQAKSDYFPTANAQAGYIAMSTGLPAANNYYAGLVVVWPLFNGFRTEQQVAEAREHQRAAEYAIADLQQRVIEEVTTTFLNWQASIAVIKKAEQTLNASREGLRLADERYKQGLSSIVELDDAQRRLTEDSAAYVTALYNYSASKAAVQRATGESLNGL
jgi:outer membrane protein